MSKPRFTRAENGNKFGDTPVFAAVRGVQIVSYDGYARDSGTRMSKYELWNCSEFRLLPTLQLCPFGKVVA